MINERDRHQVQIIAFYFREKQHADTLFQRESKKKTLTIPFSFVTNFHLFKSVSIHPKTGSNKIRSNKH